MLFVTVGTANYIMHELFHKMVEIAPVYPGEIMFQGHIPESTNLPFKHETMLSKEEYNDYLRQAELVICHAGIGTIHDCFMLKKKALVVPRKKARREHFNNHQMEICTQLEKAPLPNIYILTDITQLSARINQLLACPVMDRPEKTSFGQLCDEVHGVIDKWVRQY